MGRHPKLKMKSMAAAAGSRMTTTTKIGSCFSVICPLGHFTVLQIRKGNRDNLGIIFIFLHKNIFCDSSLEPSHQDGSNEGSQLMFLLRNEKIIFSTILITFS